MGCFLLSAIVLSFLFLVFCVILYFRYDAWFGNIPENRYSAGQSIDRITLTPGENFMKERTISWRYDTLMHDAKIEYCRIDTSGSMSGITSLSVVGEDVKSRVGHAYYYHARLSELEKGANYKYRVITGSDSSAWNSFSMPVTNDTLSFVYMGDVQDEYGFVTDSLFNLLRKQNLKCDFMAFGGDQIERPMDRFWRIWYNSLREWAGSIPLIAVAGNHEYLKGLVYHLDSRWVPQHNYPENGPKDYKGKSYFIDFPLMRMIIIDSNVLLWPYAVEQHYSWLEKVLEETTQPWKVVMFHHGVYPVKDGRTHPYMQYLFLPLLKHYGTDLILQGHDHAYSRITTKVNGDTITPVFIISSTSPKFYRNGFDPVHDRLGSGISLYQKIQITQNQLNYKSLFFDGEVYDDLIIEKTPEGKKKVIDNARDWNEIFRYDGFEKSKKGLKKKEKYLQEVKEREAFRRQSNATRVVNN